MMSFDSSSNEQLLPTEVNESVKPKRKYSKTGCKECKRRKMKCDEGKPSCWHCRRLEKECVYEPVRYKKNRISTEIDSSGSITTLKSSTELPLPYTPEGLASTPLTPPNFTNQYNSPLALPNILNFHPESQPYHQFNIPFRPYTSAIHGQLGPGKVKSESPASMPGSNSMHSSNDSQSSPLPLDPLVNIPQYFNDDLFVNNANIMAHNLNDLLNLRLEEAIDLNNIANGKGMDASEISILNEKHTINGTAYLSQHNLSVFNRISSKKYEGPKIISYNMRELTVVPQVSLTTFNLEPPHQIYLEYFYKDFIRVVFPFQPSESNNPIRDVLLTLATKNAYLMSAILACGARSLIKLKPAPEHERAYFSYLSSCLAALSKILNSLKRKLLENVEPLLLTILLLTSDNASSKNQAWRAHLRGAKDLLLMYAQAKKGPKNHASSLVFAFCATWYVTFEILAGSGGLPLGGTLDTEDEINLLINPEDDENIYLKSMGLLLDNNYNIFAGYTTSMTFLFRDLIKLLNRGRKKEQDSGDANNISVFEAIKLLSGLESESQVSIIHSSAIVPENHYLHPNCKTGPPEGSEPLPRSATGIIKQTDGKILLYSWYDISQQAAAKGSMLTIFTRILKLPKESPFVQELVHDIISLMHFLKDDNPPKVYHIMMLQAPMWEAGANCTDPLDRQKIEKFFIMLKDVGVGSAEYVLRRIKKRWAHFELQKNGELFESVEDEEELDIVTY